MVRFLMHQTLVDGKAQLVRKGLQFAGRVRYVPSYYTQSLRFMYQN